MTQDELKPEGQGHYPRFPWRCGFHPTIRLEVVTYEPGEGPFDEAIPESGSLICPACVEEREEWLKLRWQR